MSPDTWSILLEAVAVAFGLVCVWLMKKEKVAAFPVGLVNVLLYVYIFYQGRLYANAAINGYFVLTSIYGWYNWSRVDSAKEHIRITRSSRMELLLSGAAVVALFFIIRAVLVNYTETVIPSWDAGTTAGYMVAQWMLSRKKIEHWILWIAGDVVMTGVCVWQGLYFTGFQYLVFTVIAAMGLREWKGKLQV